MSHEYLVSDYLPRHVSLYKCRLKSVKLTPNVQLGVGREEEGKPAGPHRN